MCKNLCCCLFSAVVAQATVTLLTCFLESKNVRLGGYLKKAWVKKKASLLVLNAAKLVFSPVSFGSEIYNSLCG